ncbi:MAG: helix-turn-helix domain-containing protein [Acidobacteria bacterium]|jgi:transcriptional regulator with XRE-family HTH domain|nr:helix-turn-helix domain-containing protein [Acidobacteriota bacterium]
MSNKKFKLNDFTLDDFGARLKIVRGELDKNPAQMSDVLGIEKNSYYKYEDGSRFPQPEILAKLIMSLNVNMNYLLAGEGDMFLAPVPSSEKERKIACLKALFPNLPPETLPLIESLEVPIMRHSLMTAFLLDKEEHRSHIEEYYKKQGKEKKL